MPGIFLLFNTNFRSGQYFLGLRFLFDNLCEIYIQSTSFWPVQLLCQVSLENNKDVILNGYPCDECVFLKKAFL